MSFQLHWICWMFCDTKMSPSQKHRGPLLLLSHLQQVFYRRAPMPSWLHSPPSEPSSVLSPSAHPLPSATVFVSSSLLCEAPVILHTDAGLDVHAEGPLTRSRIPTFRAKGRISFSKCLTGKYVTGLETDPVKNRCDVFKPARGAGLFLPSST